MRFLLFLTVVLFVCLGNSQGQSSDPVLFTIDGNSVNASEFSYIYEKNNREDADYSEASLREYLALYTKFKLKVREAYAMQLDTIPQLQAELAGYRKQLANSYLTDKEITERLVEEAFQRMQQDIHVAHILVKTNPQVATDTLKAWEKINATYNRLVAGESWDALAKEVSEDSGTKNFSGDLGYITALLPNGFYAFETAAYTTDAGKFSAPVKSGLGYHIIKVIDVRPARGEMDISHILLRTKPDGSDNEAVKARMEKIHAELDEGAAFEVLAKEYSEDKVTGERGGGIGSITINQYEKAFEDAVFALDKDGMYTEPVRSTLGWHIIKRVRMRPIKSLEASRKKIEIQISKDERINVARQTMVERIKREAGYTLDQKVYNEFIENAGDNLQTYRWKVPAIDVKPMISLGGEVYSNIDFGNFILSNARTRMGMARGTSNDVILDQVLGDYVNEKAFYYEEQNLAKKYPEFKSLMREYEEGILLFEATKINVWDRASKDSAGLAEFHAEHRMDYMWDERIELATVTLDSASLPKLSTIKKWAESKPLAEVAERAAKKNINMQVTRKIYQKDDELPFGLNWATDQNADLPEGNGFIMVEKIIPPTPKKLEEAMGYIIADYQDQLEKDWVATLQQKYPIEVNESVLMSLVK
jgi:peptidyl-prolyl cis-trans isomerase SurA